MKRLFDFILSISGLFLLSPVLFLFMFLIWRQDFKSPFYIAQRVGFQGRLFKMVKLRSMVANADKSGVISTAANDIRITKVGKLIRRYKLDEFSQLWNVLLGQMSMVGPRPQVESDVKLYTLEEKKLFEVRPGITDLSSIIFSDEGDILAGSKNPDLKYNQLIRPWKSRLGLLYVDNHSFFIDIYIIILTLVAIISKQIALKGVQQILQYWSADEKLIKVSQRNKTLLPYPPPGASDICDLEEISSR